MLTETRRYSIAELLRLRTSLPVILCLVKSINQHPDIACIFRIPEEALRRPEQFTCSSAHLTDITNKPVLRKLGRKNVTESSEQSEPRSLELSRFEGSQQVHWHLRRRDNSDRSSQPHSAPTGFAAQQSENFQKFYRAVVSPTHVRVTAGGRIVPNTRSPAVAPSEGNVDKNDLEPKSLETAPWVQDASSVYPQVPQLPGVFLPPYNFHPQSSAVGIPIMPAPPSGYYGAGPAEQHSKSSLGNQLPGVKAQQIKISPPAQFDQTKPFSYNGQIIYPVPYGHQPPPNAIPIPIGMLGNPNFFPQIAPQPAGLMPSALPFQFVNQQNPMAFAGGQQSSMLAMPNGAQGPEPFMPFMSIPGLISPSDYMKSQLQVLQTHLQHNETLLSSDKNRVGKAILEQQRTSLLSQIDNMEELLQVHHRRDGIATDTVRRGDKFGASHEEHKSTRSASKSRQVEIAPKTDVNCDNSAASRQDLASKSKLTIAAAMAPPFQPRSRTTVTTAAGQSIQPQHEKQMSRSTSAIEDNEPEETMAEITARLMAYSTTDWLRTGFKFGNDLGYDPPKDEVRHEISCHHVQYEKSRSDQRSSTSNSQAPPVKPNISAPSSETVPYLIGTLPTGVSAQAANANDLVYSRPLTDDELRARYLYWGKAPRSVQSGLPKFDGKDFYPPSPVKKPASIASFKSVETQVHAEIEPEKLYPFRLPSNDIAYLKPIPQPVFTDAKNRATSQQATLSSTQGLHNRWSRDSSYGRNQEVAVEKVTKSVPEPDFSKPSTEKGCSGYRSPSPKPTVVRFSGDQDEAPVTPQNASFFEEDEAEADDAKSDDSWQPAGRDSQRYKSENSVISVGSTASGTQRTESTVEITLSPRANGGRVSPKLFKSFDERVENFKNADEQTMFLQQMLKNEGQAGTPLMGTVSSATAQGFLPQYRGSAAASLAPAEYVPYKSASSKSTNSQTENRPLNQDKYERSGFPAPQTAQEYLRQISDQLHETEKGNIDQGWNPNTTRTGPVRPGEEW